MSITVRTLYQAIFDKESANPGKRLFIYIDSNSFKSIIEELKMESTVRCFGEGIWDSKEYTFAGHKIFVVSNTFYHFNIVPMV